MPFFGIIFCTGMKIIGIIDIPKHVGEKVRIRGWLFNKRSSGKIHFLHIRDGSGTVQCVLNEGDAGASAKAVAEKLTLESSVSIEGLVVAEERSPSGFDLQVASLELVQLSEEYPIGKKEHGIDFLLDHRHLWLRSSKQHAIAVIRDEIIWALRKFFKEEGFRLVDTPILTPTSCEGTTTLFQTDYFGSPAYLSQSGQLYLEAACMSLGKVYDFGPVFRAEKSKTRRHLTEFWMLDAEVAFNHHEDNLVLQESVMRFVLRHVQAVCAKELAVLERDVTKFKGFEKSFVRLRYTDALKELRKLGSDIKDGEDLGNDDESVLMNHFDGPVFITHYPAAIKAFYMQPDPEDPTFALCNDLLLPEGYGETVGGSERISDATLLRKRLTEHKLPEKDFSWYVDLRKYGSVPHAGFGIGLERLVAYVCGLPHVRESIAFPRLLHRLWP